MFGGKMKIDRIEKIKNNYIFKDFKWPTSLPDFNKFNLIYGWNGSGKTTIANFFRCLEKHSIPTIGDFSISIDGDSISSADFSKRQSLPQVRVFNKDFIDENVFTATGSVTPIFFLGKESKEKQIKIQELKKDREGKSGDYRTKDSKKKVLEREIDQFAIEQAKTIRELLSSSGINTYNNYDKAFYKKKANSLSAIPDVSKKLLSEIDKNRYKKQKESSSKPQILQLSLALPDTADLLEKVNTILTKTVISEAIQTLKDDDELSKWVGKGLTLHKKRQSKLCFFCEQLLPAERLKKLEGHFNVQFNQFITELNLLIKEIETHKKSFDDFTFHDKAKLYDHLSIEYDKEITLAYNNITLVNNYLDILSTHLQKKIKSPFKRLDQITEDCPEVSDILIPVNNVIDNHNLETKYFNDTVSNARLKLEESIVAESLAKYNEKIDAIAVISKEINSIQNMIGKIESEIKEIEQQIIEHRRPADELNSDLQKYLGHTDLKFDVKETGYQISRHENPATGLSEGEQTAIAFLYFLKSLSDKGFQNANGIVVIDDPISSLDSNSLFYAFGFMKERVENVGQLFILTHNFSFFRQIKNWYHNIKPKKSAGFYMVSAEFSNGERSSSILLLDNLLREYNSEYHYLFKIVHSYATDSTSVITIEKYYHLPNIARRLLEAFLSFKHPKDAGGSLFKLLENVDFEVAKKSRIIRFLHTHSHKGQIEDPDHDISILSETPQVLADVLEMIKKKDENHFNEMVSLITLKSEGMVS